MNVGRFVRSARDNRSSRGDDRTGTEVGAGVDRRRTGYIRQLTKTRLETALNTEMTTLFGRPSGPDPYRAKRRDSKAAVTASDSPCLTDIIE